MTKRAADIEKNKRIADSFRATKLRRLEQVCRVFRVKVQDNKLNREQREFLKMVFVEGKWLYNHVLSMTKNEGAELSKINYTDITEVNHFGKDKNLIVSKFQFMPSQMRQSLIGGMVSSVKTLEKLKKKGKTVGELKFISGYNSIELKQYGATHKIVGDHLVKIQGLRKPLRVNGLKQILSLKDYEIANAKLLNTVDGYFIAFTVYTPKEKERTAAKREIGVDFGCETTLTLSDGTKMNCMVEETDRMKRLKRKASRQVKGSNNYRKTWLRINRLSARLLRKKEDTAAKISHELLKNKIVMQDEQLRAWSRSHGRKIQYSILGRIKVRLMRNEDTVVLSRWIPTTRFCEKCGTKHKMGLGDREFICECGNRQDRDVHAANNMLWFYHNIVGVERTEYRLSAFRDRLTEYFGHPVQEYKKEAAKSSA